MLNHEFTTREKILLVICAVVGLGIFYYLFAFRNFDSEIAKYDTTGLQDQIMIEEAKSMSMEQMQNAIDNTTITSTGEISVYNNQSNEISAMNEILSGRATNISITWNTPTLTNMTVRRSATLSFATTSYATVHEVLTDLYNCKYRLILQDISINSGGKDADLTTSTEITVSATLTFFETAEGAINLDGLVVQDASTTE